MPVADINKALRIATIHIYGYIGDDYWEDGAISSDLNMAKELASMEGLVDRVDIRINCYGGSVKHAWGIVSAIQNSTLNIHTYNDGMACSAAALIYLAVKKENRHYGTMAAWMYHPVMSYVYGNKFDFEDELAVVNKLSEICSQFVNSNTNQPVEWLNQRSDTWLTADEAISYGLIDAQEPYKIEDPKTTALSKNNIAKNTAVAHHVSDSYKNFLTTKTANIVENNVQPAAPAADQNVSNPAPTPTIPVAENAAPPTVDILKEFTNLKTRLDGLENTIKEKDATIAQLNQQVNAKPGDEPVTVVITEPIKDKTDDDYVDVFMAAANAGEHTVRFV